MGNTVLLATVCAAKDAVPGTDFMPLQVDYREQYSAAGRFPGGFTKREGKASDEEILTSRLVDRALRPLFPSNYHAEVYVQVMLLSADGVDQPDALAGFAASAAMACSKIRCRTRFTVCGLRIPFHPQGDAADNRQAGSTLSESTETGSKEKKMNHSWMY